MESNSLAYWKEKARSEIYRWLTDDEFSERVIKETMKNEMIGPFTKFLYHFAHECQSAGWGVMVDFNERSQKVHLTDRYYKWMHKLRDEIQEALDKKDSYETKN